MSMRSVCFVVGCVMVVILGIAVAASGETSSYKKGALDAASTHYKKLKPVTKTGQDRVYCLARGRCLRQVLTCPKQCPQMKPRKNKKVRGCFFDCSSKCEVTCKWRKAKCTGFGSLCYDPRFVGGDGVMFYFHGAKGGNFAIVSDDNIHINAHLIGTRPQGRTRDFTWVQALTIMFDSHILVIEAKRVPQWRDDIDALSVTWDDKTVYVPTEGETEWKIVTEQQREVVVERTDDLNTLRVTVSGIIDLAINIRPIGDEENRVHKYEIPSDDSFAHLETQFKFFNLSDKVEGVLGKTYRPDYVSPVKVGVKMPMMGGEDKYETPVRNSTQCRVCRFQRPLSTRSGFEGGDSARY